MKIDKTKFVIILISIYFVSVICAYFIGKNSEFKSLNDSNDKLEKELKEANTKLNNAEKRNDELLIINENQKLLCDKLKFENEQMKNDLNSIKEITEITENKLEQLGNSTSNVNNVIKELKENQKIFKEYIMYISNLINNYISNIIKEKEE